MFGYVTINKSELKVKDYDKYQAYYCGLCKVLKKRHGLLGQITLTFDMTFVVILLSGLYEPEEFKEEHRCIAHPAKKQTMLWNEITEYAADMNIILAFHNLMDDWEDDRNYVKLATAKLLLKQYRLVEHKYPRQCSAVKDYITKLRECEKSQEDNLDLVSGYTGEMLGEIFNYKEDEWEKELKNIGFYLGKFIYFMDAYEDIEKDIKSNSYNPFHFHFKEGEDIDTQCQKILTLMMGDCSREFEKLPILLNAEILRNIVYAGVWIKFDMVRSKRRKTGENL